MADLFGKQLSNINNVLDKNGTATFSFNMTSDSSSFRNLRLSDDDILEPLFVPNNSALIAVIEYGFIGLDNLVEGGTISLGVRKIDGTISFLRDFFSTNNSSYVMVTSSTSPTSPLTIISFNSVDTNHVDLLVQDNGFGNLVGNVRLYRVVRNLNNSRFPFDNGDSTNTFGVS